MTHSTHRRGAPRHLRALALRLLPALLVPACATGELTSPGTLGARAAVSATAAPAKLVISQVYGAGGNSGAVLTHDYVELFNAGGAAAALEGMSVQYASATGTGNFGNSASQLLTLSGTVQPGQYYLVQLAGGASGAAIPSPDATGTINMAAGAGKVALVTGTASLGCNGGSTPCSAEQLARIVDLVGYGSANFYEGSAAAPTLSNVTAAFRKDDGCVDADDNAGDFAAAAPAPRNSASPLGPCEAPPPSAPTVASTTPAAGAIGVAASADISITFDQPVAVSGDWFSLDCSVSGARSATASGGGATFVVDPAEELPAGETCTVTVAASNVASLTASPLPMAADFDLSFLVAFGDACQAAFTPAYTIQGAGETSPLAGRPVATRGVVVGDFEGASPALRGFYLQDAAGDGQVETSDAVFVFNGNADAVSVGDVVHVVGTVSEFQGQTQIGSLAPVTGCGTGAVAPVDVSLPVESESFLERYEGMLVRFAQPLHVTEHFQLGRFGQVVLSSGGRLPQPTSVAAPGAAANAVQAANDRNRIILDDATNAQNPDPILLGRGGQPLSASNTLRGGDVVQGVVGVLTYTWSGNAASGNAYRLRTIGALGGGTPAFAPANARPAGPPAVGGTLKVAAMNLLNYFNTFGSGCGTVGTARDCRGADDSGEFERQAAKTVAAITTLDPDVLGVIEMENDGYGATSAIADLVDRLNAHTAPGTFAFVDADAATGQSNALGTDAIKVGLLYQPARVNPVGATAVLNTVDFVNGGDGAPRNRPAIAQAFAQPNGGRVVVSVNHLKSKGSACGVPDAGDGQGNCNGVRRRAAQELARWLAADPTGTGDGDVLILGDLNAYAKEDPITALLGAGFTDLVAAHVGAGAYSYVFDGQWGYLDHALASPTLAAQVTGVAEWHVNADEPAVLDYNTNFKSAAQRASLYAADQFRVADHDPIVVGLDLRPTVAFGGFLPPVAGLPALNDVRAGSGVPVKFTLGGDRGLDVFAAGHPASRAVACPSDAATAVSVETTTAGRSTLTYDAATGQYTYAWRTEPGWSGTCRELILRFADGSEYRAAFRFR